MIDRLNKEECCGCETCVQACPSKCISLLNDDEGFRYPKIDIQNCIRCNICEDVCPSNSCNLTNRIEKVRTFAAINYSQEVRHESSSGGVFYELANLVIKKYGGVVYGATFTPSWDVQHVRIEKTEEIYRLQKSKYLQSSIGNTFYEVKQDLKNGSIVLFSGTPCQAKGLKLFLKENYNNLYIVDIACHGLPSKKIWDLYLKSINIANHEIAKIDFRDKNADWHNYSLSIYKQENENSKKIVFERCDQNTFMKGFIYNLYNRPSCHNCPAKNFTSGSDLMLADYWGIEQYYPEMDDNKGTSLIICKTTKGDELLSTISAKFRIIPTDYKSIAERKETFFDSSRPHYKRTRFLKSVNSSNLAYKVNNYLKHSFPIEKRIFRLLQRIIKVKIK